MRPRRGDAVSVTRRFSFSAAHRYLQRGVPEAESRTRYGLLATVHGHNYVLEVTVRGLADPRTGMVVDLSELKRIVGETVLARFDHAFLNDDPAFADGTLPTTENLIRLVWDLLRDKLGPERLHRLRLWEDPTFYVEYRGEP